MSLAVVSITQRVQTRYSADTYFPKQFFQFRVARIRDQNGAMRPVKNKERSSRDSARPRRNRLTNVGQAPCSAHSNQGDVDGATRLPDHIKVHTLHHPVSVDGVEEDFTSACVHQ